MTELKEFDVVRIARSDGADTGPGYWPVTAPSASTTTTTTTSTSSSKKPSSKGEAEKTPRAKPQMIRLAEDDPRFVEWRIKLGILLKQEVSPTPDEGNAWYVHFPRGYWLYEKSKHLWVSGYPVKAKLFKSPQEFGLHLLWLFSSSKEYADCCCVHCNAPAPPKQLATEEQPPPADASKTGPVPQPSASGQQTAHQRPSSSIASRPPSAHFQPQHGSHGTSLQTPTPSSMPANPQIQPQYPSSSSSSSSSSSTFPQAHQQTQHHQIQQQHMQQQHHQQHQQLLKPQPAPSWPLKAPHTFRAGELVWFQTGNTWRLGIVATPGAGPYELIPLGHARMPQPNVSKAETDLRPFHCFSVPNVDVPELKNKPFDDVPWDAVFQAAGADPVRRDHITLDASKMAASKIDASFSLWTRRSEDPASKTVTFYGCFFGAERLEIGDCVRVKGGDLNTPLSVVMGLCHIFTQTPGGDFAGRLLLRGHVYYLSKGAPPQLPNQAVPNSATGAAAAASPPSSASAASPTGANGVTVGAPVPEDKLPVALREEILWRNSIAPGQHWCAVLLRENVVLKEQSVRGRFYPTHRLLPLYDPVGYRTLVQTGQLRDQHVYLNNRMDAGGQHIGRKRNRLDTLGASVPQAVRIAVEQHVMEEV